MVIRKPILISLLSLAIITGCSRGFSFSQLSNPISTPTSTLIPTSTPTPIPPPTPIPSPQPAGRIVSGDIAFFNGDYDTALDAYQLVFDFTTDNSIKATALTMMGRIYYNQGLIEKARNSLEVVVNNYEDSESVSLAYTYLGEIYSQLGLPDDAIDAYQKYLILKPGMLEDIFQEKLGDALTATSQYLAANIAYEAAINASPIRPSIWISSKIAANLYKLGDTTGALQVYNYILTNTDSDYDRAQAEFLIGQIYYKQGDFPNAYIHFNTCVENYPKASDSYFALVALINDNQEVSNLDRGLVDYYAGQYEVAIIALNNYELESPVHDGTPHNYKALAYTALKDYPNAIMEWDAIIKDHTGDRFWNTAWEEKSYLLWNTQGNHAQGAQTLLDFVATAPNDPQAPGNLFDAARIYERGNLLDEAAATWERLAVDYPSAEISYSGIFLSAITRYRQGDLAGSLNLFQRALLLASQPADIASAQLWIGKIQEKTGDMDGARTSWQLAIQADPTGYYCERARDHFLDRGLLDSCQIYDLAVDLEQERIAASQWMRKTFNLEDGIDLDTTLPFEQDQHMIRGQEMWRLGMLEAARDEFEMLRFENELDPVNTFRLTKFFLDTGLYRSAIFAARQVLNLAGLNETATFNAPIYFNHVRFGAYYREIVMKAAKEENIDPLLLLSVIRQESLFEGFIESSAGAKGLMQIMPDTAKQTAKIMGFPKGYVEKDIYRPQVNINIGSNYLRQQLDTLDGDIYAALAGYNAGPGNAAIWQELSGNDPDLYLEVVRFLETRQYIRSIVELNLIYRMLYCRNQ